MSGWGGRKGPCHPQKPGPGRGAGLGSSYAPNRGAFRFLCRSGTVCPETSAKRGGGHGLRNIHGCVLRGRGPRKTVLTASSPHQNVWKGRRPVVLRVPLLSFSCWGEQTAKGLVAILHMHTGQPKCLECSHSTLASDYLPLFSSQPRPLPTGSPP